MARIPVSQPQQGLDIDRARNLPAFTQAPARAVQGVGQAVSSVGAALSAKQDEGPSDEDKAWFSRARARTAVDWTRKEIELRQGSEDYTTYPDTVTSEGAALRDSYLGEAPSEKAAELYQNWSDGFFGSADQRAIQFQNESMIARRGADLNDAFSAHVQTVSQDPSQYDAVLARAMDDLDGAAAWLTPQQEIEARDEVRQQLQLARARKIAKFAPLQFLEEVGLASPEPVGAADLIRGEEGFRTEAYWDTDAWRVGYGSDTYMTPDGQIRKVTADTTITQAQAEADLSRRLGEFVGQAISDVGESAWRALPDNIRSALVSVAYNYGSLPDSVKEAVATGEPGIIAAAVGALSANPQRRAREAALIRGESATAGSFAGNPYYSELSPDEIASLAHDANQAVVAQHNASVAQREAQYDNQFNDLMVGIVDGDTGLSEIQAARDEGWLTDYDDINKALKAIEARDREQQQLAEAIGRYQAGDDFNPFVKDDRDAIDRVYGAFGGPEGLQAGDEKAVSRTRAIIEDTDIVPESAVAELQMGMASRDRGIRDNSYRVMNGLYRQYPGAVTRAFDESDMDRFDAYNMLAPHLQPEELAAELHPNPDPKIRAIRKERMEEGRALAVEYNIGDILNNGFDSWWPGDQPNDPIDTIASGRLQTEFREVFARMFAISGDKRQAEAQTYERLRRVWGPTDTGTDRRGLEFNPLDSARPGVNLNPISNAQNDRRLMAYPPERYYKAVEGSHDWMGDQLGVFVDSIFPDAQAYGPIMAPQTEGAISANRDKVPYYIGVVDKNGVYHIVQNNDVPASMKGDLGGEAVSDLDYRESDYLFTFDYERAAEAARDAARAERERVANPPEGQRRFNDSMDAVLEELKTLLPPSSDGTGQERFNRIMDSILPEARGKVEDMLERIEDQ